jgi:hypothetical protein
LLVILELSFPELKLISLYCELGIQVLLLNNLKINLIKLGLFQVKLHLKLLILEQLLCIIDYPILQVMDVDALLLVLVFLGINLLLFVVLSLFLNGSELLMFPLRNQLPLFVLPLEHLYLSILLHILLLDLHDFLAPIRLPLPVLLSLLAHLLHHDHLLLLAARYLALKVFDLLLLAGLLLAHRLLLRVFLPCNALLIL